MHDYNFKGDPSFDHFLEDYELWYEQQQLLWYEWHELLDLNFETGEDPDAPQTYEELRQMFQRQLDFLTRPLEEPQN